MKHVPVPAKYDPITKLVASENCTLDDLLSQPLFMEALTKEHSSLTALLLKRVSEVISVAFGRTAIGFKEGLRLCRAILTTESRFVKRVVSQQEIWKSLYDFDIDAADQESVVSFCLVLQFLCKTTGSRVLSKFKDPKKVLSRLFDRCAIPCVNDLLVMIVSESQRDVLHSIDVGAMILERFRATKDPVLMQLLSNVIGALGADRKVLQFVSGTVDEMLDVAMTQGDAELSWQAMNMVYELCGHCDDEDESEDSLMATVFMRVVARLDEIAKYVSNDEPIGRGKVKAVDLMCGAVNGVDEISDDVTNTVGVLFKMMCERPQVSIIHCAFVKLFSAFCENDGDVDALDEKCELRKQLVYHLTHRNPECVFYGHMYKVVDTIRGLEGGSDEWQSFLASDFLELRNASKIPFGGPKPVRGATRQKVDYDCDGLLME